MSHKQYTLCRCDRCQQSANFEDLNHAQRAGWKTFVTLKIGESYDGSPTRRDICPDCVDSMAEWWIAPRLVDKETE